MKKLDKEIIEKYLRGTATENQRDLVEKWYATLGGKNRLGLSDEELSTIGDQMKNDIQRTIRYDLARKRIVRLAAAASILLLVGLGLGIGYLDSSSGQQNYYASNRARITLPDGTEVILNQDSRINYPNEFSKNSRIVELEGEAFFKVSKDSTRPFIVKMDDLDVRVLGTRFNVDARNSNQDIKVTVEEGSVAIMEKNVDYESPRNALAVLKKDEQLTFDRKNANVDKQSLKEEEADEELLWMNEKLIFRDNTLFDITETLGEWYNITFNFSNPELKDCRYTASFESNLALKEVLNLLKNAQDFDFEIENNIVLIDGISCTN